MPLRNKHMRVIAWIVFGAVSFLIIYTQQQQADDLRAVVKAQGNQQARDRAQDIENAYQACIASNEGRVARARDRDFFANPSPVPPEAIPLITGEPALETVIRAQQGRALLYRTQTDADHTLDQQDCDRKRDDLIATGTTSTTR